jgi:hypothetical protein
MSYFWTSSPKFFGRILFLERTEQSARRGLCALACYVLLSLFLVSCGGSASGDPPKTISSTKQEVAIAPLSVPAPPGTDAPGKNKTAYMPNGLPALQPSLGLKPEMMFAEKIKDQDARFDRLENAVMGMRQEFEAVKPAIIRLAAVEEDMQILLKQLEALVQNPPMEAQEIPVPQEEAPLAAVMEPVMAAPEKTAPPATAPPQKIVAASSDVAVKNVRVGEREGITRLVIDVSGATEFKNDLDNSERLLLVEMPQAGWNAAPKATLDKSPLIESWTMQAMEDGKGSRLIIRLRKNVVIVTAAALTAPDRVMIDLRAE